MGPMVYGENEGEVFLGRSITRTVNMSEDTMRKVDGEIRKIIDQQYAVARKLLEDNRDKVEAMATALLELETIDADQIDDIMSGRPPRPPKPSQRGRVGAAGRTPRRGPRRRPLPPDSSCRRCEAGGTLRSLLRVFVAGASRSICAPARDGHPQRHAGLVFRRRALSTGTRARHARRCAPTAPT
jgi:hypothetical protein